MNTADIDLNSSGMPVHYPVYNSKELWFRSDYYKAEVLISNPGVIEKIVPAPLEYYGSSIFFAVNCVREFKGIFNSAISNGNWNEFLIQIPVLFKKTSYWLNCVIYVDNFAIMLADREIFGFPKIPGKIMIQKENNNLFAEASSVCETGSFCSLSFRPEREGTAADLGNKPRVINYKQIPSPYNDAVPQVRELVALNYVKQVVHTFNVGSAEVMLLESAPQFLKDAGLEKVLKASYMDLELHVNGGKIVHSYLPQV